VLSNTVTIVSTIVTMLIISIPLTVLSLLLLPLFLWLTVRVGKARRVVATSTQKTLADLTSITEETLSVSGMLLSKSFGRQSFEIGRFREENERLTGLQIRQTMIGRSFFALIGFFFSITPALVYLVAGWVNSNHGFDVIRSGMLVGFTTLQSRLFFPIGSMLQVSTDVQTSFALFDRVFEYLDLKHDIVDAPDAEPLVNVRGSVELDHVRFRYEEPAADAVPISPEVVPTEQLREWTLDDVSLKIEPGQLAALVGPSGAGKTTITYLVPRLYDVQGGAVRIDDHDVRHVTLESLGEAIGVVTQETYLFHDTVRRNLLYGKPDATQEELESAARAANNNALPPDLSLITKARDGGPDYVFAILNGFKDAPAGFKVLAGMYYNEYFTGHQIKMPPPLSPDQVKYADGTPALVPQEAHDVVIFLSWAAEPTLEARHRIGFKVILFLIVATGVFYAAKRKIWSRIH